MIVLENEISNFLEHNHPTILISSVDIINNREAIGYYNHTLDQYDYLIRNISINELPPSYLLEGIIQTVGVLINATRQCSTNRKLLLKMNDIFFVNSTKKMTDLMFKVWIENNTRIVTKFYGEVKDKDAVILSGHFVSGIGIYGRT